ncbi:MAG: NTP transferase domain-containing protein [Clostridia bacterium]|nr:NTP transferase domain-containing protein [Clostridia bacterium]
MAGGEGSRLRPITDTMPKPLVPVDGVPVLCRTLQMLADNGATRAVITVRYRAQDIYDLLGDCYAGVRLFYADEREGSALGTAGSVRKAWKSFAKETDTDALIVSGDAVFSADLDAFDAVHREKGAAASILCVRVADPSAYGVVLHGTDGMITGFSEKPSVSQALSDTVNTGIYLLDRSFIDQIRAEGAVDFGQDVFPAALERGIPMAAYLSDSYWCDIGSFDAYLDCTLAMAAGRLADFPPKRRQLPPHISDSAVGEGCFLPATASVRRSILFDRVVLGAGASVSGSILCSGVHVGENAVIERGCVIGADARIGDGVHLMSGARIGAGEIVTSDGSDRAMENGYGRAVPTDHFFDGGVQLLSYVSDIGYVLTKAASSAPEVPFCYALIRAVCTFCEREQMQLLVSRQSDLPALRSAQQLMQESVCCSLSANHAVFCRDALPLSVARMPGLLLHTDAASAPKPLFRLHLTLCDGRPTASLFDPLGLYPDRHRERLLDEMLLLEMRRAREVFSAAGHTAYSTLDGTNIDPRAPQTVGADTLIDTYLHRYRSRVPLLFSGEPFSFACGTDPDARLLSALLCASGAQEKIDARIRFSIPALTASDVKGGTADGQGGQLSVIDLQSPGRRFSHWEICALLSVHPNAADVSFPTSRGAAGKVQVLSVPISAPDYIGAPMRYSHCPSPIRKNEGVSCGAREMATVEAEDGVLLALRLSSLMCRSSMHIGALYDTVFSETVSPGRRSYAYTPACAPTETLRRLMEEPGENVCFKPATEGVIYRTSDGSSVRVVATREKRFRIIADAHTTEAADALCELAKERLLSVVCSSSLPK